MPCPWNGSVGYAIVQDRVIRGASLVSVIRSSVDMQADEFRTNAAAMQGAVAEIAQAAAEVLEGGPLLLGCGPMDLGKSLSVETLASLHRCFVTLRRPHPIVLCCLFCTQ